MSILNQKLIDTRTYKAFIPQSSVVKSSDPRSSTLRFSASRDELEAQLKATGKDAAERVKEEEQQAAQKLITQKKERLSIFFDKDFGEGITAKKILIAIYLAQSDRNWLAQKILPNRKSTVKLSYSKHFGKYFHERQERNVKKALEELTTAYRDGYRNYTTYRKDALIDIDVIDRSYRTLAKPDFEKMSISVEHQLMIENLLREKEIITGDGDVDLSFQDTYTQG